MRPKNCGSVSTGVTIITEPLNVLILSKSFTAPGGVVNFVRSILQYLPARVRPDHLAIGRETHRERSPTNRLAPLRDNYRLARRALSRYYRCVHLNPSMNMPSLLRDGMFLLTLRLAGCANVLVYFHGWDAAQAQRIARNPVARTVFRFVFDHARVICVLATPFKETLVALRIPAHKIHVTTTMFDPDIFDDVERCRSDARSRVIFLGRLVEQKGVFETLDAFAELIRSGFDAELVMAGDGPERARLERRAAEQGIRQHVSFPGYLHGKDKSQALLNADLFVFPTYYGEGCPVSLLEAMAAGLPVITGSAGGIPDIFTHGRNGLMLDHVAVAPLACAMRELLSDPQRRARISADNRHDAWLNYRAEAVVAHLMGLYLEASGCP